MSLESAHMKLSCTTFVDAHCHFHLMKDWKTKALDFFNRCSVSKINFRFILNGVQPSDWCDVQEMEKTFPTLILPSYGVHPWYATQVLQRCSLWKLKLVEHLENNSNAGIGEIGLDFSLHGLNCSSPADQRHVFEEQLKTAVQFHRVISIHCVKAHSLLLEILASILAKPKQHHHPGIILHSFSGSYDTISKFVLFNCYFSLSATSVTASKKNLKRIETIPKERLLVESDAPSQFPSNLFFHQFFKHCGFKDNVSPLWRSFEKIASAEYLTLLQLIHQNQDPSNPNTVVIQNECPTILLILYRLCEYLNITNVEEICSIVDQNASHFSWRH